MKPQRRLRLLVVFFWFCPLIAFAQSGPSPGLLAQREAMAHVAFLVGHWKGSGWMDMGAQRVPFRSAETVESRLDGLVLVVEGKHEAEGPGRPEPVVVHHALAMLTYDPDAKVYYFNAQVHRGGTGRYQGHVENGAFVWGMPYGDAQIRYTIRLDEAGRWHEIGERSADGATWIPFFEMTLDRIDAQ